MFPQLNPITDFAWFSSVNVVDSGVFSPLIPLILLKLRSKCLVIRTGDTVTQVTAWGMPVPLIHLSCGFPVCTAPPFLELPMPYLTLLFYLRLRISFGLLNKELPLSCSYLFTYKQISFQGDLVSSQEQTIVHMALCSELSARLQRMLWVLPVIGVFLVASEWTWQEQFHVGENNNPAKTLTQSIRGLLESEDSLAEWRSRGREPAFGQPTDISVLSRSLNTQPRR